MMLSQRLIVGGNKRVGELLFFVTLAFLQGLASKGEAAEHPHQALGGGTLLLALFVLHQPFECFGDVGCGVVSRSDFLLREIGRSRLSGRSWDIIIGSDLGHAHTHTHLDVPLDVSLNGREGGGTQEICVRDEIPMWNRLKQTQWACLRQEKRSRNTDAPNKPRRPPDASRNAKVSTPASVIGTSA